MLHMLKFVWKAAFWKGFNTGEIICENSVDLHIYWSHVFWLKERLIVEHQKSTILVMQLCRMSAVYVAYARLPIHLILVDGIDSPVVTISNMPLDGESFFCAPRAGSNMSLGGAVTDQTS